MTKTKCLQILELETLQSLEQLHHAYRQQVKRWHPDQFARRPAIHAQAEERLKEINRAYSFLKESIPKNPMPTAGVKPERDASKNDGKKSEAKKPKSENTFKWSWWFRSGETKHSHRAEKKTSNSGGKAKKKATFVRKRPSFSRVLREATGHRTGPKTSGDSAEGKTFSRYPYTRRKKGMRVEGFKSAKPITPVRPVSKINRIEGSD